MSLDDFLDPSGENHADEPDLSDRILDLSSGGGGDDGLDSASPCSDNSSPVPRGVWRFYIIIALAQIILR